MDKWLMTVGRVLNKVEDIRHAAGDAEAAHGMEDQLHQDVLEAIANGRCQEPKKVAAAALLTKEIEFPRWCA